MKRVDAVVAGERKHRGSGHPVQYPHPLKGHYRGRISHRCTSHQCASHVSSYGRVSYLSCRHGLPVSGVGITLSNSPVNFLDVTYYLIQVDQMHQ